MGLFAPAYAGSQKRLKRGIAQGPDPGGFISPHSRHRGRPVGYREVWAGQAGRFRRHGCQRRALPIVKPPDMTLVQTHRPCAVIKRRAQSQGASEPSKRPMQTSRADKPCRQTVQTSRANKARKQAVSKSCAHNRPQLKRFDLISSAAPKCRRRSGKAPVRRR